MLNGPKTIVPGINALFPPERRKAYLQSSALVIQAVKVTAFKLKLSFSSILQVVLSSILILLN